MALPTSKAELVQWVKEELGEPVIRVNLSPEQYDKAIDTALQFWQEYNESGQERVYIKTQITAQNIADGYVLMPDEVQAVYKVIDPKQPGSSGSRESLFDVTYQFMQFNVRGFSGANAGGAGALSDFYILRTYMAELDKQFSTAPQFRFRHTTQRCYIDFPAQYYSEGDFVLFEVQAYTNPATYARVWQNRLLRNLSVAYAKKIWGNNLSKFQNINLPSGLTINGEQLFNSALQDIEKYEQEIMMNGEPTGFIIS